MVLVGQEKRLAQPASSTRPERRALAVFVGLLVAGCVAAAVVYLDRGRPGSRCVTVTIASYTGGVTSEECGARAAAWCREAFAADRAGARNIVLRSVQSQCRRAGYLPPTH